MISIKTRHVAIVVPVVFAAGIGLTIAFNLWKTENTKVPAAYASGEFAGKSNPADIRGSYTFADIVQAFPVPLEELARAFGVTENAAAFQVKSLEGAFEGLPEGTEIGTDSVRLFVARYAGLPFEPAATTALPAAAVAVLDEKGGLSAALIADLKARAVGGETAVAAAPAAGTTVAAAPAATTAPASAAPATTKAAPAAAPEASPAPAALTASGSGTTDHAAEVTDRTVKGSTTFKMLLDWGVSEADIRKLFGGEMGATGVTVRDYCTEKGIEFSTVKTALQDLVNAAAP
jgi:hypothetical protein